MPTASTGAVGVSSANKYPAVFLQVQLGAGTASAGGRKKKVLIFGQMTTGTGTMTAGSQVVHPTSIDDASTYAGPGSELHLGYKAALTLQPDIDAYMIAIPEPSGAKATATITIANAATGSGDLRLYIHGQKVTVGITSGQSAITIAANVSAAINGLASSLCVTASPASAVVTVTYRHNGTRGNAVTLRYDMDSSVTATTVTLSAATLGSGTGSEVLTAAIATIAASLYHRIAVAMTDTTGLQAVQVHLLAQVGPTVNREEQAIYCSTSSLGTATTQVQTLNEGLMQGVFHPGAEDLPIVVASAVAAVRAAAEEDQPSVNISKWNIDVADLYPVVQPQSNAANYMTDTSAASALDVGLTPLQVTASGHVYIVRSITTHSQDASGNPDTRQLDTSNVTVPQAFAEELLTSVPSEFAGLNLIDDPLDSDDEVPPRTTTPARIKGFCSGLAQSWARKGWIDATALPTDLASWSFNLAASSPGRVNATMPIHPPKWFVQFSGQIKALS